MQNVDEMETEWSDDMFDLVDKYYGHAYWALEAGVAKDVLIEQLNEAAECLGELKKERDPADRDTRRNRWWGGERVTDDLLMCVCSKACATSLWQKEKKLQNEFASGCVMWNCIKAMRAVRDAFQSANTNTQADA
jgi:hypothetical protein